MLVAKGSSNESERIKPDSNSGDSRLPSHDKLEEIKVKITEQVRSVGKLKCQLLLFVLSLVTQLLCQGVVSLSLVTQLLC